MLGWVGRAVHRMASCMGGAIRLGRAPGLLVGRVGRAVMQMAYLHGRGHTAVACARPGSPAGGLPSVMGPSCCGVRPVLAFLFCKVGRTGQSS